MMKKTYLFVLVSLLLVACSPKEPLTTETISMAETYMLADDSLYISIQFDYPTDLATATALCPLQEQITGLLFEERNATCGDVAAAEAAAQQFIQMTKDNYILYNQTEITDEYTEEDKRITYTEIEDIQGSVVSIRDNVLTYYIRSYHYSGGAHGMYKRTYYHYDLTTGKELFEQDFFTSDYRGRLTRLLIEHIIAQEPEIDTMEDLQENFFVEYIIPNNNFYFTDEGVTYVFNCYEIAPYAYADTEVTIPYSRMQSILR